MNMWELPISLEIGGVGYSIRTDYRVILDILHYFTDPNYDELERQLILIRIIYTDWEKIPGELYGEAVQKAVEFIDMGLTADNSPSVMDWEQDAQIIIPAVNKVIGKEVRSEPYMHWWTFLSAYMSIGESLFSEVINIRLKKAKGKKLEKYEKDFYNENKQLIDMKTKYSDEEIAEQERLKALLKGDTDG